MSDTLSMSRDSDSNELSACTFVYCMAGYRELKGVSLGCRVNLQESGGGVGALVLQCQGLGNLVDSRIHFPEH